MLIKESHLMEFLGRNVRVSIDDYVLKSWINIRFVSLHAECLERTNGGYLPFPWRR